MASKRKKSRNRRGGGAGRGIGMFFLGIVFGSISTYLATGILDERPGDPGAGIEGLISQMSSSDNLPETNSTSPTLGESAAQQAFKFGYHEFLLEDEYVLPQPALEETPTQTASVAQPEQTTKSEPKTVEAQPAPSDSSFVLQVGSFKKIEDADSVKANLALQGQLAYIQKVTVEGRGDFFRVRLGPFDQLAAVNETSQILERLGYPSIRFRVKN